MQTKSAIHNYYDVRAAGAGATQSFYTDLSNVSKETIKVNLENISKEASVYLNSIRAGITTKALSEHYTGTYRRGTVFYQLMKKESRVQDYKLICIRDKTTRAIYSGVAARDLLKLPHTGVISLSPKDHGNYDIFIQSTAVNRKIPWNSYILIWYNFRKM